MSRLSLTAASSQVGSTLTLREEDLLNLLSRGVVGAVWGLFEVGMVSRGIGPGFLMVVSRRGEAAGHIVSVTRSQWATPRAGHRLPEKMAHLVEATTLSD